MPIPFAAIGAGLGALGGLTKMIGGAKRRKRAERALANLQSNRQEFRNIHEGRRISTRGAEFAREGIQGTQATSIAALQSGGVRGVVGGIQGVQNSANQYLQQEGAGLDQQQVALDRDMAMDEQRIQSMNEQRQMQDEAQAQAAINAGQQDAMSGLGDITGAAFGAASLGVGGQQAAAGATPYTSKLNIPTAGYAPVNGIQMGAFNLPPVFVG